MAEPTEEIKIKFSDMPIGFKFILDNVEHRKTSATATYGIPKLKNSKRKRGIYNFKSDTVLIFKNNNN